MVNMEQQIDDAKCCDVVLNLRWSDEVKCPECNSAEIKKRGRHDRYNYRPRYECKACGQQFDDLSGMIFQWHH
jgi:transposase-like protein